MASPFETEGTFLTQEQADHINERHVLKHEHVRASKFESQIDLVDLLKTVSEPWEDTEAFYWKYHPTQWCFLRGQLIRLNPI